MGYSEQRGGQLTKYFLDTYAKNLDVKRYSVDSKFEIGRECSKGNYKFSNMFRSMPHDNQFILDEEVRTLTDLLFSLKADIDPINRDFTNFCIFSVKS